jgi:hypothetical protein
MGMSTTRMTDNGVPKNPYNSQFSFAQPWILGLVSESACEVMGPKFFKETRNSTAILCYFRHHSLGNHNFNLCNYCMWETVKYRVYVNNWHPSHELKNYIQREQSTFQDKLLHVLRNIFRRCKVCLEMRIKTSRLFYEIKQAELQGKAGYKMPSCAETRN